MGRGGRGKGGGGRGKKGGSGIEKYGKDKVDEFMALSDDDQASDEAPSEYGVDEEVLGASDEDVSGAEDDEPEAKNQATAKKSDWRAQEPAARWDDFYGGDQGADTSENESDEELIAEEARLLEERRLQRLQESDFLSSLGLAKPTDAKALAQDDDDEAEEADEKSALKGAAAFDAAFAGAEVDESHISRDLSELSGAERHALLKKEAPELQPLLTDFKTLLDELQRLGPLLAPDAKVNKAGVKYVEAKRCLLLNTLANLSFYLMLRAQGVDIRAHPVVAQLVWLKELRESLTSLDKKLKKQVKKAIEAQEDAADDESEEHFEKNGAVSEKNGLEAPKLPEAPKRLSLREEVEMLRSRRSAEAAEAPVAGKAKSTTTATLDLLRLPKMKKGRASGGGPEDLDGADPTLGAWAPTGKLGDHLSAAGRVVENARKATLSADHDVDFRPKQKKDRRTGPTVDELLDERKPKEKLKAPEEDLDMPEEIRKAKKAAAEKKKSRVEFKEQEHQARREKQFHPDQVIEDDGRRKTQKKILDNRGLVRHRKKTAGNARVTNRKKFEKAQKRRKGAVQEMRVGASDGATYVGEETGIKANVRKSQRLS